MRQIGLPILVFGKSVDQLMDFVDDLIENESFRYNAPLCTKGVMGTHGSYRMPFAFINIENKSIWLGMPGVQFCEPAFNRWVSIENFKIIYKIVMKSKEIYDEECEHTKTIHLKFPDSQLVIQTQDKRVFDMSASPILELINGKWQKPIKKVLERDLVNHVVYTIKDLDVEMKIFPATMDDVIEELRKYSGTCVSCSGAEIVTDIKKDPKKFKHFLNIRQTAAQIAEEIYMSYC